MFMKKKEKAITKYDFTHSNFGVKKIKIPGINKAFHIRQMSGLERREYLSTLQKANLDGENPDMTLVQNQMLIFLALAICDENGTRLFDSTQQSYDDIESMNATVLMALYGEAVDYNGLSVPAEDRQIKNSETTQAIQEK